MKSKIVDVIDIMLAVRNGELRVVVKNGFFMLENINSGERVKLNEVPVKYGKWENNEYGCHCSVCKHDSLYNGFNHPVKSNFCPYCGNPMEK